jgi:hypothetical protein
MLVTAKFLVYLLETTEFVHDPTNTLQ